jgi:hypothetical protein
MKFGMIFEFSMFFIAYTWNEELLTHGRIKENFLFI